MEIAVGMHQNQGKREYQQDMMSIKNFGSIGVLAILADGMGGYEGGEIASKLISDNFREFTIEGENIAESLKKYLLKGNQAITHYKEDHPEVKSMGSTAIAFFLTDKTCQWVSVGDSPLYVIRDRSTIRRINENHSVAGLLDLQVKNGEITQEEALSSSQRHMLTSAVSGEPITQMDLSVEWSIKKNDIFILASDGIETIGDSRIKEIVLQYVPVVTQENMQKACEVLVSEVLSMNKRNQDNVTVILLGKIDNNEPQTIIYGESTKKTFVKKKVLEIIGGVIVLLLVLLALYYYLSKDESTKIEDFNKTVNPVTILEPVLKEVVSEKKDITSPKNKEKVLDEEEEKTLNIKSEEAIEDIKEKNITKVNEKEIASEKDEVIPEQEKLLKQANVKKNINIVTTKQQHNKLKGDMEPLKDVTDNF